MRLDYNVNNIFGKAYGNGNIKFLPNGHSLLSPIDNRILEYDLLNQTSKVLPFELRSIIKCISISHDGTFAVIVDIEGHGIFVNLKRYVTLRRLNFKKSVSSIQFSPNDAYFGVACGNKLQIWKVPGGSHNFSPLVLSRSLSGHNQDISCFDWSIDSKSIVTGSKDLNLQLYRNIHSKFTNSQTVVGHRDELVGVFFASDSSDDINEQSYIYSIARDGGVYTWINDNSSNGGVQLHDRTFLWSSKCQISSVTYNANNKYLLIGRSDGVIGMYEVPGMKRMKQISVSTQELTSVCTTLVGNWIAIGSSSSNQLVVWEWRSATYIMKQKGHLLNVHSMAFSDDANLLASGGEDGEVKVWDARTGVCIVTFNVHRAPVTGICFSGYGTGQVILSTSLDGTVRAHDLLKYKNFRTLVCPESCQLTCLAVDFSGEIVCAGSNDPFTIFVWSLQTGQLLEMLDGHEGPLTSLNFKHNSSVLASSSWDGTLKLWDVYKRECTDTFEHGCDVLDASFQPNGEEICTVTTNGYVSVWNVEDGVQRMSVYGGNDTLDDKYSASSSQQSRHFTTITYAADGSCVICGGNTKFICIYNVNNGLMLRKFSIDNSYDRGINDNNPMDFFSSEDNEAANANKNRTQMNYNSNNNVVTKEIRSVVSGTDWAVATSNGLYTFGIDTEGFTPIVLTDEITSQYVAKKLETMDWVDALNGALSLGISEKDSFDLVQKVVEAIPKDSIPLVLGGVVHSLVQRFIHFIVQQIDQSPFIEWYLTWCWELIKVHGSHLKKDELQLNDMKQLLRIISTHDRVTYYAGDTNEYMLQFLSN